MALDRGRATRSSLAHYEHVRVPRGRRLCSVHLQASQHVHQEVVVFPKDLHDLRLQRPRCVCDRTPASLRALWARRGVIGVHGHVLYAEAATWAHVWPVGKQGSFHLAPCRGDDDGIHGSELESATATMPPQHTRDLPGAPPLVQADRPMRGTRIVAGPLHGASELPCLLLGIGDERDVSDGTESGAEDGVSVGVVRALLQQGRSLHGVHRAAAEVRHGRHARPDARTVKAPRDTRRVTD